jgi:hypothetical protein
VQHLASLFAAALSKAGYMSGLLLLAAGTAQAQGPVWGPAANTVIGASDHIVSTAEIGADNAWLFNTLTVTGGYLQGERLYAGLYAPQTISISGGHVKVNLSTLGYDYNTTVNQSGGILEATGLSSPFAIAIGRQAASTVYNMTGGQLLIGGDLYMPGNPVGSYGIPGALNFSGGEIVIQGDNWSSTGFNILGRSWFRDLSGNAQAVWDGVKTTIRQDNVIVTTFAGSTPGFQNGPGASALFDRPNGVAVDAIGNVYVADRGNHQIRKITPAGVVSTFAGSTAGFQDGPGTSARFNDALGVAVDANGNVYVADSGNHRIRKITPAGDVTTLAGSTAGFQDGPGASALFNTPIGVAVDANGNVYVGDRHNQRVRKITPAGDVTTLAGSTAGFQDGPGASALFFNLFGVAVDANGNVYVADYSNHRIRKITPAGVVSTLAGSTQGFQDGPGASAQFNGPFGVAVDANGNVHVGDESNQRIRKITPAGVVSTLAGSGILGFQDGPGTSARFNTPRGVAFDANGNVYVGDQFNNRIRKISSTCTLYDRTFTGAQLNDEVTQGRATYPNADTHTVTGTRLDLSPAVGDGDPAAILFRMRILPASALTSYENVVVTVTIHWDALTADNDFGIAISDGTRGIGGMQGNTPVNWSLDSPDTGGPLLVGENFSPAATIAGSSPETYTINLANLVGTSTVQVRNNAGSSIIHSGLSPLNYGNAIDFLLVGNNGDEIYGVKSVSIRVTALCGSSPPVAAAGADFSVNEGQTGVMLDGSGSSDPDSDPLTYAWTQVAGLTVTLSNANAQQPTFTAPTVALGGGTLTFKLTVTANGESDTDTVDVTVVNINHPPVAEADVDQSVAEGSPVTLDGTGSFDIDTDIFTYAWVQVGTPTVTLSGANTANPTFTAPVINGSGAPGVVATLVFRLTVDDGFNPDAPAPGYSLTDVVDEVTIDITNVNNLPIAAAGVGQTVNENAAVTLTGTASSDPDGDTLTYAWVQVGTPTVTLSGANTASPTFTAPFVSGGGVALTFELTVDDGYGGTATDTIVVNVQNANDPPLASAARPSQALLWPPNHGMVAISILGVTDPNNNATITITGVWQDEATNGLGDGDTPVDAIINPDGTVLIRAERAGNGNGRVYHIHFTAADLEGSSSGVVKVSVPHNKKSVAVDGGALHVSTAN